MTDDAIATICGAVVGAIGAMAGGVVSGRLTDRASRDSWFRERLSNAYSEAVYYLTKLQLSSSSDSLHGKDVRQHRSEAVRFLVILLAYTRDDGERATVQSALNSIDSAADSNALSVAAKSGVATVEALLHQDKRIVVS